MDTEDAITLPAAFDLGVSTSAFQTEGTSGRGESIWDRFLAGTGMSEDDRLVAADHLAHVEQDMDLVAGLGVSAYRFSLSWPRLQPEGKGRPRREALDLYDRLVDEALARGLDPWPCLYHWDLPQPLQDRGGWRDRDTAYRLADYAEIVAEMLGGRARRVFVLNEPNVHSVLGHLSGVHAPGVADLETFLAAVHHLNLAHGLAVARLREAAPNTEVGTILSLQPIMAAAAGEEHEAAAGLADSAYRQAFLDPLLGRGYPEPLAGMLEPHVERGDLELIAQPIDVLGVNYYTRLRVLADDSEPAGLRLAEPPQGAPVTAMGWEVDPSGLTEVLTRLRDEYGNPPVAITECGAAFEDAHGRDGRVDDLGRARFIVAHLRAALAARDAGCDVRGFLVWTLVDNLEWTYGFDKRFGLVRLERPSMRRIPKLSYDVLASITRSGEVPPPQAVRDLM